MSDFAGALFGGAAAQAADESLQRWRALWQQEEAMRLQQEDAERNRQFTRDMQADAQAFQQLMARKAEEFQLGLVSRQEAFALGTKALELQPNMSVQGQEMMRQHLKSVGSQFLPLFESNMRVSMFNSPADAVEYLRAVHEAPLEQKLDPFMVEQALDVAISIRGLKDEEAEKFRASYLNALELRNGKAESLDEVRMELANLEPETVYAQLENMRANTQGQQAQTQLTMTETARVAQEMGYRAEDRPRELAEWDLKLQQLASNIRATDLASDAQAIQNQYLPRQLEAQIGQMLSETMGTNLDNSLKVATFNDAVKIMAAEADLTTEEARHIVATGALRDMLVRQEYEHGQALIASVWQDIEASKSSVLNDETYRAQVAQGMLFEVIANGDSKLMGTLGADILRGMGLSEGEIAELTAGWGERMDAGLSRGAQEEQLTIDLLIAQGRQARSQANVMERTEDAQVRDAEATAAWNEGAVARDARDYAQRVHEFNTDQANMMERHYSSVGVEMARIQEGARQHNENLAQRQLEAQDQRWYWEQQVSLEGQRLAQQAAANAAKSAAPASYTDFLNSVQDSTGIGLEQLQQNTQAASDMAADLEIAQRLLADPNLSTSDKGAQIAGLLGIDPLSGLEPEVMVEQLKAKAENARLLAVSNIVAYQKAYAGFYPGQVMTMEQLGLTDAATNIYTTALTQNGVVRQQLEAEEAALLANPEAQATINNVYTALNQYLIDVAPSQGPAGLSIAGAQAIHQALLDEFTPEQLELAGLGTPAALLDSGAIERAAQVVMSNQEAEAALERLGATGINLNTDHAAREAIVDELNTEAREYLTFANRTLTPLADISQAQRGWWQGLLGAPQAMPEPTPAHLEAGARLVAMLEGVTTPDALLEQGILGVTATGHYYVMNPAAATAYLNGVAERRQAEARAVLERSRRAQ